MAKSYTPNSFEKISSDELHHLSPGRNPHSMAASIKRLSDIYHRGIGGPQIWDQSELEEAYISYYLPLNWLRLKAVIAEAQRLGFFTGISRIVDFGSGPGTFHFAALDSKIHFDHWTFVEKSSRAKNHHRIISTKIFPHASLNSCTWTEELTNQNPEGSLVVSSYSLNELTQAPQWLHNFEAILLVEPSTVECGRKLQEIRSELIKNGYSIWAPCTHQDQCPLLTETKNDWCHHRIHFEMPPYLREIENFLPMKNTSLTYSYLLARKKSIDHNQNIRVIGDTLFEKGKIRQAICGGPQRQFLSWLTRNTEPPMIQRGARIPMPSPHQIKGNEIRVL